MAVYLWYQYLIDLVGDPQKVYAVADSSIFFDPLVSLDILNQK